jgi:predicted DNA-binding protein with PD1-like motif
MTGDLMDSTVITFMLEDGENLKEAIYKLMKENNIKELFVSKVNGKVRDFLLYKERSIVKAKKYSNESQVIGGSGVIILKRDGIELNINVSVLIKNTIIAGKLLDGIVSERLYIEGNFYRE